MNFKNKLYNILKDLNRMGTKEDAMIRGVSKKLDYSLETYNEDLTRTCDYLISRSSYKVMKGIAKQQKLEEDK